MQNDYGDVIIISNDYAGVLFYWTMEEFNRAKASKKKCIVVCGNCSIFAHIGRIGNPAICQIPSGIYRMYCIWIYFQNM